MLAWGIALSIDLVWVSGRKTTLALVMHSRTVLCNRQRRVPKCIVSFLCALKD